MNYSLPIKLICLISLFLASCTLNPDIKQPSPRYGSPATLARHTSGDAIFITDDSVHLFPFPILTVPDSMLNRRYFIDYQVTDSSNTFTYTIALLNLQLMPIDTVRILPDSINIDNMKNAPVNPHTFWCSGHYLNMLLYINASGMVDHKFRLIDTENHDDGILHFALLHDDCNDKKINEMRAAVSFDIRKYMDQAQGKSFEIKVTYNTENEKNTSKKIEVPAANSIIK